MKNFVLIFLLAVFGFSALAQDLTYVDLSNAWKATPTATINGIHTICDGQTADLVINFTEGPVDVVYTDGLMNYSLNGLAVSPHILTVSPSMTTVYTLVSVDNSSCSGIVSGAGVVTVNSIPILSMGSIEPTQCYGYNNGEAEVSVLSGDAPYSYLWDNGVTTQLNSLLSSGDHYVTVTDNNGCQAVDFVTIGQPDQLELFVSSTTNVNCTGPNSGSATVYATGGTTPYSYDWGGGMTGTAVSNLTVGTYIVTVTDANGCQATTSVVIGQDPVLNATAVTLQNVTCSGSFTGQAEANATGGTAPYSYLWNNGQTSQVASGLAAGSYSVTVTDNNGCQSVANATITEPPLFEAVLSSTDVSCDGSILGTADVVATGGTPAYSYNWNTGSTLSGITGLTTGSYAVTVTDANGCQAAGSPFYFSIGQDPVPVANASIVSGVSTSCSGDPVDLEATGGDTYSWSNGMTGSTITVTPTVPTWYYVTVSNSFGCSDVDSVFVATNEAPIITFVPPTNVCGQSGNPIDLGLYASVYEVGGQTANIWFTGVGVASGYFYPQTVNVGGTYPVTAHYTSSVTGCSDTAVALISVHAPPTTSLNIPQGDICLSDAPFILTGGSPVGGVFSGLGVDAVTGSFDPGLAGVGNHSITYTYTDPHGCEALANDIIIVHAPTSVILSMPATELCEGESMQMSGSPAGGYYLVNGIANSSVFMADDFGPGNYTIVYGLTSAMCGGMDTAYVTVHASPNVTLTGPSSVMVDDPTVMLQISPPGGLLTVDGVPAGVYFDPAYWGVGVHNVVYTYDNGNCSDQASLQITIDAVGIDDVDIASLVTVYPNPVSDILNIEMGENANISEIQIYSILGELVYSSGVDSDVYRVDVSGLAPTVYFIRFVDKDGLVSEPLKFLKQ